MSVYYMNEAAFDLPDGPGAALADKTVTELYFAGGSGGARSPFTLTVHRRPLAPGLRREGRDRLRGRWAPSAPSAPSGPPS